MYSVTVNESLDSYYIKYLKLRISGSGCPWRSSDGSPGRLQHIAGQHWSTIVCRGPE